MYKKLRVVKSEVNGRFLRKKIKVERERTPQRFSRRLRKMAPDTSNFLKYFSSIGDNLKKEKTENKAHFLKESSVQGNASQRSTKYRKLRYPYNVRDPKEVITILSAPKICNKKQSNVKKISEVPVQVRGSSCRQRFLIKNQNGPVKKLYMVSKNKTPSTKEGPGNKLIEKRKHYVLEVLNHGNVKEIEKLHSVGSKTAERIMLYRQLKGSINKISELAKMPKFPKNKFNNFVAQNFLKVD